MDANPHSPIRTKSAEELLRAGWTERFVAAPLRIQEVVSLYESLGYEVHLEPLTVHDLADECHDCIVALSLFRVIYTRPKAVEGVHI